MFAQGPIVFEVEEKNNVKDVKLLNGKKMPEIGLGTWLIDNDTIYRVFMDALKLGYTHFDSAQDYFNEENLGKAIKECGVPRESLFITSKVASHHKSYEAAKKSIQISLEKLGEYIDCMLIHCPKPWKEYHLNGKYNYFQENKQVWKALEEFYYAGKLKSIGVSNFSIADIKNLLENCRVKPMVNQIPVWIGNTDRELIKYCQNEGIIVQAYSPIAHGRALKSSFIKGYADKYGVSISQFCLKYTLQLGLVTLPKTTNADHMKENLELNFKISEEDMKVLTIYKE